MISFCNVRAIPTGLAVALGVDVGLDVETADRAVRSDPLRLARRRFSPAEAASLDGARLLSRSLLIRFHTCACGVWRGVGLGMTWCLASQRSELHWHAVLPSTVVVTEMLFDGAGLCCAQC